MFLIINFILNTTFRHILNNLNSKSVVKLKNMKTISIFLLLIYWSVMIFAPVIKNNTNINENKKIVKKL
jgi:hypothetical protein